MTNAWVAPILYTSADADPESGAFRCMLDMGMRIANWGYQPILALAEEPGAPRSPPRRDTFPRTRCRSHAFVGGVPQPNTGATS